MEALAMRNVLITGGAGFIGRAIARRLLGSGVNVRVFDNFIRADKHVFEDEKDIELLNGDIRDIDALEQAVQGVDTVFHLAYINGTKNFYERPDLVLEIATKGMINLLDLARVANVQKIIYFSSSEVYQEAEQIPTPEDVPLVVPDVRNPRYSYGGGKIIGELLMMHNLDKKCCGMIIRPHNVYGPNMGWEHVVPDLVKKIFIASDGFKRSKVEIEIQGDGSETRAFCYIDDAVHAIMKCAEKGTWGEVYNIGVMEETSILELIQLISDVLSIKVLIKTGPLMKGSTKRRCPDVSKVASLGYYEKFSLKDGLITTVEWYKNALIQKGV